MKRIAIVGGGISGLAAAFALEERRRAGEALEFVVYESGPRFGGVLFTEQVEGCLIEAGPDSFLTEKPWAADLCRRLGIEDQLIGSNDGDRKTYILVKGRLVPMPDGLMFMVPTQLSPGMLISAFFSAPQSCAWRVNGGIRRAQSNGDESVAALVERHYGAEMVDRLADPLLAGVYGGEASQLSVRAVLPRFVEMESKYGSLGRGMLAARKNVKRSAASASDFLLSQRRNAATGGGIGGQASRGGVAGKLSRAGRAEAGSRLGGFGGIRFRSIRCGDCGHAGHRRGPAARNQPAPNWPPNSRPFRIVPR